MGTQEARGQVQVLGSRGYQDDTMGTPLAPTRSSSCSWSGPQQPQAPRCTDAGSRTLCHRWACLLPPARTQTWVPSAEETCAGGQEPQERPRVAPSSRPSVCAQPGPPDGGTRLPPQTQPESPSARRCRLSGHGAQPQPPPGPPELPGGRGSSERPPAACLTPHLAHV